MLVGDRKDAVRTLGVRFSAAMPPTSGLDAVPKPIAAVAVLFAAVYAWFIPGLESPFYAVAPFVFVLFTAVAARQPGMIFALYILIPFYKGGIQPYLPVDITIVLAGTCAILALPKIVVLSSPEARQARQALLLWSIVAGIFAIGVAWSPDPITAAQDVASFLVLVYFPCLLALRIGSDRALLAQFILSALGVVFITTWIGFYSLGNVGVYQRLESLGSNTIGTARAALLLPLIGLIVIDRIPRTLRVVLLGTIPVSIFVALSTGSRGPLLMVILAYLGIQVAVKSGRFKRLLGAALGCLLLFAMLQLQAVQSALPSLAIGRLRGTLDAFLGSDESAGIDRSSATRIDLWQFAWTQFKESPLRGMGTASFEFNSLHIAEIAGATYPHNVVLHMLSEYGFIGALIFSVFVFYSFRQGARFVSLDLALAAVAVALFALLNSLVSNGLFDNRWMWGSLLVIMSLDLPDFARKAASARESEKTEMFELGGSYHA